MRCKQVFALSIALGAAVPHAALADRPAAPSPPAASATPERPLIEVPDPPRPQRSIQLEEAFVLARHSVTDLEIAELAIERARASERISLATLLPSVNGTLQYTHFDSAVERSGIVFRQQDAVSGNLTASENISLRNIQSVRTARANRHVTEAQLADAQRTVLAAVARAYFSELAAQRNSTLARSQLANAERQHRSVLARVQAGIALQLDASRSELAMLEAAQRVTDVDASLARAQDVLGQALGLDEPVSANEAELPQANETVGTYVQRALEHRGDMRASHLQEDIAALSRQDAWFRFAPTLGVSWNLNWTPQTTSAQPNPLQWSIVASLAVPFYDGGARYGALRDANAAIAQAQARTEALERSVRNDIRDAYRRVTTAGRAIELARQSEAVSRLAYERSQAAYAAGTVNGLDVDTALRTYEQAQITVLVRALDRQLAMVDLLTAAGAELAPAEERNSP